MSEEQLTGHRKHHHHHHAVSVGEWVAILLLMMVPVVGMGMLIQISLRKSEGSKKNFGVAALLCRIVFDIIIIAMIYYGLVPHWDF